MTHEQFLNWAAGELAGYERSPGFKNRLAYLEQLQAEGVKLSLQDISNILLIPLWLCELGALKAYAQNLGHIVMPENAVMH